MRNFGEMARGLFSRETGQETEQKKLLGTLEKQLAILEKFMPHLPEQYKDRDINLPALMHEPENMASAVADLIPSEELSNRAKAYDQVRLALTRIFSELNKYITEQKSQWTRVSEINSELTSSLSGSKITESPDIVRGIIGKMKTVLQVLTWLVILNSQADLGVFLEVAAETL